MPRLAINVDDETLRALIAVAVEADVSTEEAAAFLLRETLVEGDENASEDTPVAPGMSPQVG